MKKVEKIIVLTIIVLSLLTMGFMMIPKPNNTDSTVIIKVDNQIVKEVSINNSNQSKLYEFKFHNHIGQVETKNGRVRMVRMPKAICPKGICADTGWINKTYQSIVCLPNKIVVTIQKDKNQDDGIDIIL